MLSLLGVGSNASIDLVWTESESYECISKKKEGIIEYVRAPDKMQPITHDEWGEQMEEERIVTKCTCCVRYRVKR